jgi:hypothetical protein
MEPIAETTCPRCGKGTLIDISFDQPAGTDDAGERPRQDTDSRQGLTYSCGHIQVGASLAGSDADQLDVERRTSEETAEPLPERAKGDRDSA